MLRTKSAVGVLGRNLARSAVVVLLLFGAVSQVIAKVAEEDASRITLGELETLQAETLLYEARLARDKARNELKKYGVTDTPQATAQMPTPTPQRDDTPSYSGAGEIANLSDSAGQVVLPQIIQIFGQGHHLQAKLLLNSSLRITVSQGSKIPGTPFVVRQITPQRVEVQKPGEPTSTLVFAQ